MKVLLLNDRLDPTGGSQLMTLTLARGLRARGHSVRTLASNATVGGSDGSAADYACFGSLGKLQTLNRTCNPSAVAALRRALREFDPDVVHVRAFLTQLSPAILPLLRNRPSIMHACMYDTICPTGSKLLRDGKICQHRAGWVCRRECLSSAAFTALMAQRALWRAWRNAFDRFVAVSGATAASLEAEGIGPVQVLWNGVAEAPPRPPLADPPSVAIVTRFSREKGVDVAIRAFAIVLDAVPNARLLIVGDGPLRAQLHELTNSLNISHAVEFAGRVPLEEINSRVAHAWVQIAPALWHEPFGSVAAEAMMRGTAVVASNRGGFAEIIADGETGFLTPSGDAPAMARALALLLTDRARAEEMGKAARARARALFSVDRMLDQLETLFRELVPEQYAANTTYRKVEEA